LIGRLFLEYILLFLVILLSFLVKKDKNVIGVVYGGRYVKATMTEPLTSSTYL